MKIEENIQLERKINIIDVGANPINEPPYKPLLKKGLCRIIGFEPQEEAFKNLLDQASDDELYFNTAIGSGNPIQLNIYKGSGFTSAYPICRKTTDFFNWKNGTRLEKTLKMQTTSLDEIADLPDIDLLKIDIQGGEFDVFSSAKKTLKNCSCIITEVNFLELYENGAPSFADIHNLLTSQGFILHKFLFLKSVKIPHEANFSTQSQLIDGDAVYIRDIRESDLVTTWQLKCLAVLSEYCFSSKDLSQYCLDKLKKRQGLIQ